MSRKKIVSWIMSIIIVALALIFLLPLYIAVINSVKPFEEVLVSPLAMPQDITMNNFIRAFTESDMISMYINSIIITFCSVVLLIFVSSLAAYVIARRPGNLMKIIYVCSMAGIMVPPIVTLVPSILTLDFLGLLHTRQGLFLFYVGTFFSTAIFLYVQFIKTISPTMDEAAIIDGAGQFTLFYRVIFPMLKPCTATAIIFFSMWIWNDFMNPLFILGLGRGGMTVTTGVFAAIGARTTYWNLVFANVILASLPIVVLYLCMQKQFMTGMTQGAIKG